MSEDTMIKFILSIMLAFVLMALVFVLFEYIFIYRIFKKAGKPGWAAFVPIYNLYTLCDIVDVSPWWILIVVVSGFIPYVGNFLSLILSLYFSLKLNSGLARSFGKGTGFAVGLILAPIIFYPMLAFGKSEYIGNSPGDVIIFRTDNNTNNIYNPNPNNNYNNVANSNINNSMVNNANINTPNIVGNNNISNVNTPNIVGNNMNVTNNGLNNSTIPNQVVNQVPMQNINQPINITNGPVVNEVKNRFCTSCGAKVDENAKFCTNCGSPINHQ